VVKWRAMMRPALFAALLLSLAAPAAAQGRALTADVQMHKIESKHLPVPRDLVICLPPGYEADTARRYPVFYMHDGSNVYVEWKLDEVVRSLVAAGTIEPVILALIPNGGSQEDRFNDYTPTKPANVKAGGKADAYGRMLIEEVKPFVDATYRTRTEPEHTGLGGASLGGMISLYFGLKHPEVFGKLAVMSPSVWWDNKLILRQVRNVKEKPALRIWVDVGTGEGGSAVSNTRELRDALKRKGWTPGEDLGYLELKGATHDEASFARRAEDVLTFLFPAR
jgi:predicted alpha/beta superfamily hydrolase